LDKSTRYKIFNDPIHGFITVPKGVVLKLIDHPYVQRLRRIRQLGLGYLVFPAAEHSRFSHALGALELMQRVLNNLREKDTTISRDEYEGSLIAILLHDVGHGPLSHTLEHTLIRDFNHEMMTLAVMRRLNQEFEGALDSAIDIFTNQHSKTFLHQLVSSQLDIDRLDYLKRDSFFTGVYEGSVGIDRILKTMRVFNGQVVIERKGIYAIENYILARRLMYMQVYLHKTVLSADHLLKNIFKRVQHLIAENWELSMPSDSLAFFLHHQPSAKKQINQQVLDHYLNLDDNDIFLSIKYWQHSEDPILADLCDRFLNRTLFRTTFQEQELSDRRRTMIRERTRKYLKEQNMPHDKEALQYYLAFDESYSEAYQYQNDSIWILEERDRAVEFSKAADTKNIIAMTKPVVKPYIVHLKEVEVD
jgi:HD superfamily phosphohydrolase